MSDIREVSADRDQGNIPPSPVRKPAQDADLMREELSSVIASPDFARAPIMKRLLSFLVGETAAGRGDQLKAYSVAVDGLGRAPDYDARADSYPRVQVGRLRRMLDSYYRSTRPSAGLRLMIPSGRYRVTLQPAGDDAQVETADPPATLLPGSALEFGWHTGLILLFMLLTTIMLVQLLPLRTSAPAAARDRPVIELVAVRMANESALGNLVRASLINGLARSAVYDLRYARRSGERDPKAAAPRYRLGTDLIEGPQPRLFLRLTRTSPERLIWSGDIGLPDDGRIGADVIDRALAPAITMIGHVNGIVATHELQELGNREAVGHACLLTYHRYRKERNVTELEPVRACVERSLKLDPGNADLQAAAAQLTIERMLGSAVEPRDRPSLLQTARRHAELAGSIDPFDPWSNMARARVALARNACPQATSFALRAARHQPYDPLLLADAGLYLLDCGDPRAEGLIRQAIALDGDPDGRFHTTLLLLAIGRGDHAMAREALGRMEPPASGQHAYFYLVDAAGRAMIGDAARARASWAQLRTTNPHIADDPQGFFERIGYAANLRDRAIGYLRGAGLIAQAGSENPIR